MDLHSNPKIALTGNQPDFETLVKGITEVFFLYDIFRGLKLIIKWTSKISNIYKILLKTKC